VWNHVVGFLFLSLLLVLHHPPAGAGAAAPTAAYLGGVFGALFVAVNSYVFPRLGAMKAALLVIGGQMLAAVLIDWHQHQVAPGALRCLGVAIVLLGICLSRMSSAGNQKRKST
jgi:transporter family-2 protein